MVLKIIIQFSEGVKIFIFKPSSLDTHLIIN